MTKRKETELEKEIKNNKRGSVNNANRLAAFQANKKKGSAEWSGCSPEKIQTVIDLITQEGGAVLFGLTRNQGAHNLTLILGASKETLYFNGDADLDEELDRVAAMLGALD